MRAKKIRGAMKTLFAIDARIGRSKWRKAEPSKRKLTRDELISRLAVAEAKAGRAWNMISLAIPKAGEEVTPETFRWSLDWERIREARAKGEGTCLLRTNPGDCDPKTLWKKYMIQGEIEYAFRELKGDLGLRPVYHQLEDRIEAHIFTSFMALRPLTTLRALARRHAPGLTPRQTPRFLGNSAFFDANVESRASSDDEGVVAPDARYRHSRLSRSFAWGKEMRDETRRVAEAGDLG